MLGILAIVLLLLSSLSPAERSLRAQLAAHTSWGKTPDRPARTAKARKAFEDTFLAEAGGDPKRAESLRAAYFVRLSFQSAQARRRRGDAAVADLALDAANAAEQSEAS